MINGLFIKQFASVIPIIFYELCIRPFMTEEQKQAILPFELVTLSGITIKTSIDLYKTIRSVL